MALKKAGFLRKSRNQKNADCITDLDFIARMALHLPTFPIVADAPRRQMPPTSGASVGREYDSRFEHPAASPDSPIITFSVQPKTPMMKLSPEGMYPVFRKARIPRLAFDEACKLL